MAQNLTPKQARFVEEYLIDLNATQAAIRAGYSAKNADQIGPRMVGKSRVAAAIAEGQKKIAKKLEITQEWVLTRLRENVERAMQIEAVRDPDGNQLGEYTYAGNVANTALGLLGKHLGMFKDQQEVQGALEITIRRVHKDPGDNDT